MRHGIPDWHGCNAFCDPDRGLHSGLMLLAHGYDPLKEEDDPRYLGCPLVRVEPAPEVPCGDPYYEPFVAWFRVPVEEGVGE